MKEQPFDGLLAVLSCVHGNLAALQAVLRDVDEQGIREVVCLGDLVGYGPEPNRVVELVRERGIEVVQGCWDAGIGQGRDNCGCSFATDEDAELGELAYTWTDLEVSEETREYLKGLPIALGRHCAAGKVAFVHGSPASNTEYLQLGTHELILLERASRVDCDVLMCGHTHVPFVKRVSATFDVQMLHGSEVGAESAQRSLRPKTLINAGSVGEPRHGGPQATYVVFEQATGKALVRYVAYDVASTQRKLEAAGLPRAFGERLAGGQEIARKRKDVLCAC